jgi:uncharacterized small protein (DUF1192 family)
MGQGMARFQGRNDALDLAAVMERPERLGIGRADIFRAAAVLQEGMLGPG